VIPEYTAHQHLPVYLAWRHNTLPSPTSLRHTSSHQPGPPLPSRVTSFMDVPKLIVVLLSSFGCAFLIVASASLSRSRVITSTHAAVLLPGNRSNEGRWVGIILHDGASFRDTGRCPVLVLGDGRIQQCERRKDAVPTWRRCVDPVDLRPVSVRNSTRKLRDHVGAIAHWQIRSAVHEIETSNIRLLSYLLLYCVP